MLTVPGKDVRFLEENCPRCGQLLPELEEHCKACGWMPLRPTELVFLDTAYRCPDCGKGREPDEPICPACGSDSVLHEPVKPPNSYGLGSLFTVTTLVALSLGVAMLSAPIGVMLALLFGFGYGRSMVVVRQRATLGYPTTPRQRRYYFMTGAGTLLAGAFIGGLCAFCTGAIFLPLFVSDGAREATIATATFFGLISLACMALVYRAPESRARITRLVFTGLLFSLPAILIPWLFRSRVEEMVFAYGVYMMMAGVIICVQQFQPPRSSATIWAPVAGYLAGFALVLVNVLFATDMMRSIVLSGVIPWGATFTFTHCVAAIWRAEPLY